MVVSRNRSCCSFRTTFFLYFATYIPRASLHGRLRSVGCMIAKTVTLMARMKSCQDDPTIGGVLISTLRISAFLCDSAVILRYSTLPPRRRGTQRFAEKISEVLHYPTISVCLENASKTPMKFLREQKDCVRCQKSSLSGKGQAILTAQIPAPGGDE